MQLPAGCYIITIDEIYVDLSQGRTDVVLEVQGGKHDGTLIMPRIMLQQARRKRHNTKRGRSMNRSELIGDIAGEVSRVLGEKAKDDDLTAEDVTTVRDAVEDVLNDAEKVIEESEDEDDE